MKKSGVIFDARKLRPPGIVTILSLLVASLLIFFSYQHFVTPTTHTAHAQYYPPSTPNNPATNANPGYTYPTYNNAPTNSGYGQNYAQRVTPITIQNMQFMPSQVTIPQGSIVVWYNRDTLAHTTTSDNGLWHSGVLQPGQSFSRMFATPGTYTYHCAIHPFMHGTIIVTQQVVPPAPVPSSMPPANTQPIMYSPPMTYSMPSTTQAPSTVSATQSQNESQSVNSSGATNLNMQQTQSQSQSISAQ